MLDKPLNTPVKAAGASDLNSVTVKGEAGPSTVQPAIAVSDAFHTRST